jgi:multiple sugar transport system substrate-binding protein
MFAGGAAPEVSVGYAAGFVTFFDNKAIQPIDDYVKNDKLDLSFLDKVAAQIDTREPTLWGMPVEMIPYVTFYRPDLFEKAGLPRPPADWNDKSWTLDKAFDAASKIANDTGDPTKAVYGIYMFAQQLGNIAWLWGADPFNDQGGPELSDAYKTGKVTKTFYTQDKIVECFQYIVDLTYKHKISPKPSDTAAIQQAAGWPFLSGRIGMWMDGQWNTTNLLSSKLTDWKYAMAPYPYGPRGHNTEPAGDNAWFLGAKCKHPDAAWKFIRYVGLEEGAVIHAKLSGFMPANPKVTKYYYDALMQGPIDMSRSDLERVCSGALEHAFPMPGKTLSKFPELNKTFTQTTATIWSAEKSVKDGLADCQKAFEQLVKTLW